MSSQLELWGSRAFDLDAYLRGQGIAIGGAIIRPDIEGDGFDLDAFLGDESLVQFDTWYARAFQVFLSKGLAFPQSGLVSGPFGIHPKSGMPSDLSPFDTSSARILTHLPSGLRLGGFRRIDQAKCFAEKLVPMIPALVPLPSTPEGKQFEKVMRYGLGSKKITSKSRVWKDVRSIRERLLNISRNIPPAQFQKAYTECAK